MKIMNIDKTSIIITLFILIILVVASPAQAAITVDPDNEIPATVPLGDAFEFDITIDDVNPFVVIIQHEGTPNATCYFDRHGNNLKKDHGNSDEMRDECKGIKIRKPGHEYGYGYGYAHDGNYKYRVRIETNKGFIKNHYDHYEGQDTQYKITLKLDSEESDPILITVTDPTNKGKGKK